MKLSTLSIIALSFVPSLVTAAAIPNAASRNETLAKRGGEVNYLANCGRIDRYTGQYPNYPASYMAWYSNVDNSQGGQLPDSLSNEYRDWSNGGTYLHWEGQQHNLHFPDSGVTVETHIDADAQSRAFTAYAGYAYRPADGKTFNCYKDNSRFLFDWSPPGVPDQSTYAIDCNAIYWCV